MQSEKCFLLSFYIFWSSKALQHIVSGEVFLNWITCFFKELFHRTRDQLRNVHHRHQLNWLIFFFCKVKMSVTVFMFVICLYIFCFFSSPIGVLYIFCNASFMCLHTRINHNNSFLLLKSVYKKYNRMLITLMEAIISHDGTGKNQQTC